jgi:hypothetical protein
MEQPQEVIPVVPVVPAVPDVPDVVPVVPVKKMSAAMKHYYKNKEKLTIYYGNYYKNNAESIKQKRRDRYHNQKEARKLELRPAALPDGA